MLKLQYDGIGNSGKPTLGSSLIWFASNSNSSRVFV